MNLVQKHNQSIKQRFEQLYEEAKADFQKIAGETHPLFLKAVDELFQLDYEKIKTEMTQELIQNCQRWLNNEDYTNKPMDAILFEYDYTYLNYIEALSYGIVGDLSGYDYDFVNGIEAEDGISLTPLTILSFIDDDYAMLSEQVGFQELNHLFGSYIHLLVQEVFASFAQSDIFKKITRQPIFFLALGEHDMDEIRLYYVCDDDEIFRAYLTKIENEQTDIESKEATEKKYAKLKYRVSELLDILVFSDDDTQIDIILDDLQELIDNSLKHKYWAIMKLGSLFMSGKGVKQDINKAQQYFEIVVNNGKDFEKRQSCMMLATLYYSGKGVVKNLFKAQQFITTAHKISTLDGRFLDLKMQIEKEIKELNN